MQAYFSYWQHGLKKKPDEYMINLHKISVYLAKQHFKKVHLLTDSESAKCFKDINFDSVEIIFDQLDPNYHETWSISKLFAYKHICEKGEPFIHIDYDVFLWGKLEDRILNADLFAQSPEKTVKFFYQVEKFITNCSNLYDLKEKIPNYGINVGIFGGKDLEFIHKYSLNAINFVFDAENKNFWLNFNKLKNRDWAKAVIAEQYYLSAIVEKYKKSIEYVFPNGWPSPEDSMAKKYTHLMGSKKQKDMPKKIKTFVEKYNL